MTALSSIMRRHRFFNMYLTTTISVSLVLFLIGLECMVLMSARNLIRHVRENVVLTVVMQEKTLVDRTGPPPCLRQAGQWPLTHRSLPTSSPSGPETAAPLVEQGHLWLGCDEGPEVGRPQEHVCRPEAVTVPGREREEGRASTGAGRGLSGRGEGWVGGASVGRGRGSRREKARAQALPRLQKETPRPQLNLSLVTDSGSITLRTVR